MRKVKNVVIKPMKICNNCGNTVDKYQIFSNAVCCEDCFPTLEKPKKIPNESTMLKTLLNYNATNTNNPPQKD